MDAPKIIVTPIASYNKVGEKMCFPAGHAKCGDANGRVFEYTLECRTQYKLVSIEKGSAATQYCNLGTFEFVKSMPTSYEKKMAALIRAFS